MEENINIQNENPNGDSKEVKFVMPKLMYIIALQENGLTIEDLPKRARTQIDLLNGRIQKAKMNKSQKVLDKTYEEIADIDEVICDDIARIVEDKEEAAKKAEEAAKKVGEETAKKEEPKKEEPKEVKKSSFFLNRR